MQCTQINVLYLEACLTAVPDTGTWAACLFWYSMAVFKDLQRNTGLLCGVALPL